VAAAFLAALSGSDGWNVPMFFQSCDDRPTKNPQLNRAIVGSLRRHAGELLELNYAGACIAVAINEIRGNRRVASQAGSVRAVFIDCDAALARPLALAPSISVKSQNGAHYYWLLHAGEPVSLFAAAQRQLAAFYGSDPTVSDPCRVMRVPGFLHQKSEPFVVQLMEADTGRRYSLRETMQPHDAVAEAMSLPRRCGGTAPPEAIKAFRTWAAAAPRHVGARNITAFVMAAEGLKTGVPTEIVAAEVRAYCERAGIPAEAAAVLRSAHRRAGQ
jgi:hypothetical protein